MSRREQVTETAIDVIDGVVRTIDNIRESRRVEPRYWAAYHELQHRTLPRWRWLARAWHLSRARSYRSHLHASRRGQG